jgi:hypothetical protein
LFEYFFGRGQPNVNQDYTEFSPREILEGLRQKRPLVRVQTARDVTPGNLALAMSPLLVNWRDSSLGFGPDDYYLVHNVNVGANPIEGTTLLGSVRIPAAGVEAVEFAMVLSKVGKVKTDAGHAMLRFIFREDARPVIHDAAGRPLANNATFRDLVLSWEAWRPPVAAFDPVAGLDPQTYALTPRALSGSVRCLCDAILDRPWVCYPLQLPDVPNALDELLYVSLLLGDAVARQTIGSLLNRRISEGRNLPEDYRNPDTEEWVALKEAIADQSLPEDPIGEILEGKVRYHLLQRSCITMALMALDWAHLRICRRGTLPDPPRVKVAPESLPGIMDALVGRKRRGVLIRIPTTLHWLMKNQTVVPGKAHLLLDQVGLLQHQRGKIVKREYDNRVESPYGVLQDHLIY